MGAADFRVAAAQRGGGESGVAKLRWLMEKLGVTCIAGAGSLAFQPPVPMFVEDVQNLHCVHM